MPHARITFVEKAGTQVVMIRGEDRATVYYPTPPSMARVCRAVRKLCAGQWFCLPFSNGWIAQAHPSYHEPAQKTLNISSGQTDVKAI